jgi:hypothetical protein
MLLTVVTVTEEDSKETSTRGLGDTRESQGERRTKTEEDLLKSRMSLDPEQYCELTDVRRWQHSQDHCC